MIEKGMISISQTTPMQAVQVGRDEGGQANISGATEFRVTKQRDNQESGVRSSAF